MAPASVKNNLLHTDIIINRVLCTCEDSRDVLLLQVLALVRWMRNVSMAASQLLHLFVCQCRQISLRNVWVAQHYHIVKEQHSLKLLKKHLCKNDHRNNFLSTPYTQLDVHSNPHYGTDNAPWLCIIGLHADESTIVIWYTFNILASYSIIMILILDSYLIIHMQYPVYQWM